MQLGTRLIDTRSIHVAAPPSAAFAPIRRIGGEQGWYHTEWLWRVWGFLDLLVGGVGLRCGRRDPVQVTIGDVLDFWRVKGYEPDRRLRLWAETKVPRRSWREFEVQPEAGGRGSTIRQTAVFNPAGLLGLLYWYGIYPLHARVFQGMLEGIAKQVTACNRS